jgi:hypothetical protein
VPLLHVLGAVTHAAKAPVPKVPLVAVVSAATDPTARAETLAAASMTETTRRMCPPKIHRRLPRNYTIQPPRMISEAPKLLG